MYTVILAGGNGTRLWPRSRQTQPKQFVDIMGAGRTMIQATADRLAGLVADAQLYVVTSDHFAALTAQQLPHLPADHIIGEPCGRNSAPAIGLACVHLYQREPTALAAFLPADHMILDVAGFQAALRRAAEAARQGYLVTLGIRPDFPHTGYGYIQRGYELLGESTHDLPLYTVDRFLEKPNRALAEAFVADGNYYWNGGIFICRVDRMLAEIERQMPALAVGLQQIAASLGTAQARPVLEKVWPMVPSISIDYGVMEGAEQVVMVPLDAGWNDVGSWDALESLLEQDSGNNFIAKGDTVAIDSQGNIVYSDKRIVALIDVADLVVVETDHALLVGQKAKMQKVKEVVEQLRSQGRNDLL